MTEPDVSNLEVSAAETPTIALDADDIAARRRVEELLGWGQDQLDLLSSSFRGCNRTNLDELRHAQRVQELPAAYEEFMARMGIGGPGSAIAEIFPADDVSYDSMMPALDWPGGRRLADEIIEERSYPLMLGDDHLVIRLHRAEEIDFVPIGSPDPPVHSFTASGIAPSQLFDCFTDWLEFRIGRAIKRRYPLRSAHCKNSSG